MGVAQFVLLSALAALLLIAAIGDWRTRTIENWLNAVIALGAPLWWWASGEALWPDAAIHLGVAAAAFAIFTAMFAIGAMGGGDVKLITALALWFPLIGFIQMLTVMALVGGVLTLVLALRHRAQRAPGRPEIPYGIAIASAGLWTIFRTIS